MYLKLSQSLTEIEAETRVRAQWLVIEHSSLQNKLRNFQLSDKNHTYHLANHISFQLSDKKSKLSLRQSQRIQTIQGPNQNLHVSGITGTKPGKACVLVLILVGSKSGISS